MSNEAVERLLGRMVKIEAAPTLRTVNGTGLTLAGTLLLPGIRDARIAGYWFTFLFLPLLPLRLYVVSGSYPGPYRFHGAIKFRHVYQAYGSRAVWLVASAWLQGIGMLVLFGAVGSALVMLHSAFGH